MVFLNMAAGQQKKASLPQRSAWVVIIAGVFRLLIRTDSHTNFYQIRSIKKIANHGLSLRVLCVYVGQMNRHIILAWTTSLRAHSNLF